MKDVNYYSIEAIRNRTERNYALIRSSDPNSVRNLDMPAVRYESLQNLKLIEHLLDEQYTLFGLEAKIASESLFDFKKERAQSGKQFGYLCSSVECLSKTISCRFYKRTPSGSFKHFRKEWLNPGKMRKISYLALQKACADIDELRMGMQTEIVFRVSREGCIDTSKMRSRIRLLHEITENRKHIYQVFKVDRNHLSVHNKSKRHEV